MTKVPQNFQAPAEYEPVDDEGIETPDNPPIAYVDARRTKASAPDAVWVCLVARTPEDATDPEAKQIALRYVASKYAANAPSIDQSYGPMADDGAVRPPGGVDSGGDVTPISARQYLQMAAAQNLTKKAVADRFCYFVRVRRNTGV